ncbi:MAG: sigma-70 family RNA polymerase sigma factor [Phycisphaerae bacterium]|nr:sigma-70 family RNA polymerase sigma factor [Phycisphaerae bacterium]
MVTKNNIDTLVKTHIHLADEAMRRYRGRFCGVAFDDIYSDTLMGLFQAARRYRTNEKASFTTFARRKIRHAIQDGFRTRDYLTRTHRRQVGTDGPKSISLNSLSENGDPFAAEDRNLRTVDERDTIAFLTSVFSFRLYLMIQMYFWDGMTYEQIGQYVGLKGEKVGRLIRGALEEMRQMHLRAAG